MPSRKKCPQTKEEFVNKILSYDFDGDIRKLGDNARIERATPQSFFVYFPDIDRRYELTVSIPRNAQTHHAAPRVVKAPVIVLESKDETEAPKTPAKRKRTKESA